MDAKVVFHEFPEDFDAALESEQSGIPGDWREGFGEDFVERGKGFYYELEFEFQVLY